MELRKKIAVIGGTGKSGKYLVKQLINQGFHIRLLIRNPEKLGEENSSTEIVYGNVRDYDTVNTLMSGCGAVISTLGLGKPQSEASIFSKATENIIKSMHEQDVNRYIVITGLNVDTPTDKKGSKTKSATDWMYKTFPESTTDKQKEYAILSESDISWTMVRLPMIEQTDSRDEIQISLDDCLGEKISATDLAFFLIGQLFDENYIRKAPFLSNI